MNLKLKDEISVPDAIAGISACGVAVSVFYNWGFFLKADPSMISLLTLQDHFLGALIGAGSVGIGFFSGRVLAAFVYQNDTPETNPLMQADPWKGMNRNARLANPLSIIFFLPVHFIVEGRRGRALAMLLGMVLVSVASLIFLSSYYAFIATIAIGFTVSSWHNAFVAANLDQRARYSLIALGICAISYSFGVSQFEARVEDWQTSKDRIVLDGTDQINGKIIRYSSSYIFMFGTDGMVAIPVSKANKIFEGT